MKPKQAELLLEFRLKRLIDKTLLRANRFILSELPRELLLTLDNKAISLHPHNPDILHDAKALRMCGVNQGLEVRLYLPSVKRLYNSIWNTRRYAGSCRHDTLHRIRLCYDNKAKGLLIKTEFATDTTTSSWFIQADALSPLPPLINKTDLGITYFIPLETISQFLDLLKPLNSIHKLRIKIVKLEIEQQRIDELQKYKQYYEKPSKTCG